MLKVTVERTAVVTITLDEKQAAYLAALVGNVGGALDSLPHQMCRGLYTALLDGGLTPPRFADVYEVRPGDGGVYVRAGLTGSVSPK